MAERDPAERTRSPERAGPVSRQRDDSAPKSSALDKWPQDRPGAQGGRAGADRNEFGARLSSTGNVRSPDPTQSTEPKANGPGVRANPDGSAPNRCTKPGDFPDFSYNASDATDAAAGALNIIDGIKDRLEGRKKTGAVKMGLGVKQIVDAITAPGQRGLSSATPDQVRCHEQRQRELAQQRRERDEMRALYRRSF